jgi:hypothetical protein
MLMCKPHKQVDGEVQGKVCHAMLHFASKRCEVIAHENTYDCPFNYHSLSVSHLRRKLYTISQFRKLLRNLRHSTVSVGGRRRIIAHSSLLLHLSKERPSMPTGIKKREETSGWRVTSAYEADHANGRCNRWVGTKHIVVTYCHWHMRHPIAL